MTDRLEVQGGQALLQGRAYACGVHAMAADHIRLGDKLLRQQLCPQVLCMVNTFL